jgi:hypothetical protein
MVVGKSHKDYSICHYIYHSVESCNDHRLEPRVL